MNRDTPDAVPSEDFPFLGPAISPRRREAGAPLQDGGELAGPFVGGMFGPAAEGAAPTQAPAGEEVAPGDAYGEAEASVDAYEEAPAASGEALEAEVSASDEEELEALTSSDWGGDDFPWLVPSEPEGEAGDAGTPWRATGELEELAAPEAGGSAEEGEGVDHYSWIGERLPQEGPGDAWDTESPGPGLGGEERVAWDEVAAESAGEATAAAASGAELESDAGDEGWVGAAEWGAGVGEASEGEELFAAERFVWEEETEVVESVGARWEADEGFRVGGEEAEAGDTAAAAAPAAEPAGLGSAAAAAEPPVEAAPLPVGEWEASPSDGEVEEEPAAAEGSAGDPLAEVAERLERIARALRSGKPIEAAEEGDPLQLLITGYALGYSQARRGRS